MIARAAHDWRWLPVDVAFMALGWGIGGWVHKHWYVPVWAIVMVIGFMIGAALLTGCREAGDPGADTTPGAVISVTLITEDS